MRPLLLRRALYRGAEVLRDLARIESGGVVALGALAHQDFGEGLVAGDLFVAAGSPVWLVRADPADAWDEIDVAQIRALIAAILLGARLLVGVSVDDGEGVIAVLQREFGRAEEHVVLDRLATGHGIALE